MTAKQIPLIEYLALGEHPHLVANECESCSAKYFDRRNACGKCGETTFKKVEISTEGTVRSFTVVSFAAPGVPVPFVAVIVDCAGASVSANLINVTPDPAYLHTGMRVRLTTFPIGVDSAGTEAIGFAFEPAETTASEGSHNA
jgi:uncharacterized protein